jgi:hypothetical protein
MLGDGGGGAYVAWSERSQVDSFDERIRVSWVYNSGTRLLGNAGVEFPAPPGRHLLADVARTSEESRFLMLYDEMQGGLMGRLVLQNVAPGIGDGRRDNGLELACGRRDGRRTRRTVPERRTLDHERQ